MRELPLLRFEYRSDLNERQVPLHRAEFLESQA